MSRPTNEEIEVLKEFRGRLGHLLKTKEQQSDHYLLRWLRARNLSLEKSEFMFLNSMKWREDNNIDNIFTKKFDPWVTANYPFWNEGTDCNGRPVVLIPFGLWDMRKAIEQKMGDELISHLSFVFEGILATLRKINESLKDGDYPVSQCTVIFDWKNYAFSQLLNKKAIQNFMKMGSNYEAHYPEVLYKAFFINCPSFISIFMTMLKPVVAAKTLEKISCHSNRTEWEPLLKTLIPINQLPTPLGGTHPSIMTF